MIEKPEGLEPQAPNYVNVETTAAVSSAISLKRIADLLESIVDPSFDAPAVRTRESR